jgi:hypothetical protein
MSNLQFIRVFVEVYEILGTFISCSSLCMQIKKNIGLNFIAGFCLGITLLAAVARQVIIRIHERDNKGSVADLIRRGQLKSGQRGMYVAT